MKNFSDKDRAARRRQDGAAPARHFSGLRLSLLAGALAAAWNPAAAQLAQTAGELKPVVVSSTRVGDTPFNTPASVDLVDGDALRDSQLQINLSEGLGGVPGLLIQNRQNYAQDLQISIRGFGARSTFGIRGVRLYVDGIPATLPDGQGQSSNIDIGSIERVEVLRGPFSALYGNSSGGVLQVFTEEGSGPPTVSSSVTLGSYGTRRLGLKASGSSNSNGATGATGGKDAGAIDYLLSTSRFTTDGYREHSAASKNLANGKLGIQLDQDSKLTLIMNSVELKAQDPLGLSMAEFQADPRGAAAVALQFNTRKTVQQTQGGLVYERRLDASNELRLMTYYGTRQTVQFQSIPPGPQANPLHAGGVISLGRDYGGADARWTSRLTMGGQPLTLIAGIAYDTLVEQRQGYQNFIGSGAAQQLGVQGALRRDESNHIWNADPYLQGSWQFAPRWTLDAGLRRSSVRFDSDDHYIIGANGDDSGSARYQKTLPMAALRYQASTDLNLYATAGRGFETPTSNELSYRSDGGAGPNFGLQPSVNTSLEVGAKLRTGGNGLLTAALFQTTTDDEIVSAGSSGGRATFRNAGRTLRQGMELGWNGAVARNWLGQIAYTWLDATYRDGFCSPTPCSAASPAVAAGNRIPGIASQVAFAALTWAPQQGWRAGVEGRYVGKIYVNDLNTSATAGYFAAAVHTGYRLQLQNWELSAFARIDNLFDRQYFGSAIINESNGRYFEPAPGRNWSTGINVAYHF
jgi:iron complex outermembrane recepter protein